MKFGAVPASEADGAILVHSVSLGGRKFKKGRLLSAEDTAALTAAGIDSVKVVRLEAGDIPEDEAATAIAKSACGDGVVLQAAFTGRCNLHAETRGIAMIDRARVDALNMLDEAVTIATVDPYDVVEPGQLLATIKIIPFAAPQDAVAGAVDIAGSETPLIAVRTLHSHHAGLIMTELVDTKTSVLDKTARVLSDRLTGLGSELAEQRRCAHDAEAIARSIGELRARSCDPILIFGASAITDRRDEIPSGIVAAGGVVEHFGMPVDPGNLLLLGRLDDVPVIGLPGCARSPKLNGFDWVLQRLLADIRVTPRDIMRMGAGGLLKEIALRPQPRAGDGADQPRAQPPRAPRIAALVLAAGQSRRMGVRNKLTLDVEGKPMIRHAVDAATSAGVCATVVVTGHERDRVLANLDATDLILTHNPDYAEGLSTSLRRGLASVPADVDGVVVLLGDMPRVTANHVARLIAAFNPTEGRSICVPTYGGKRGNPVLFSRALFAELSGIAGDVGAKHAIGQHEDEVAEVPMPDDAIFLDIDTPAALASIKR